MVYSEERSPQGGVSIAQNYQLTIFCQPEFLASAAGWRLAPLLRSNLVSTPGRNCCSGGL